MSELKPRITENGIDYILVGDYYIPGLKLPEEHRPIGKYGRCLLYTSFDPRDGTDNGLTVDRAQELGEQFCKEHFPGHQALICTHPDGHNHSGNIHVHIVINSLRIYEVPLLPYMDRPCLLYTSRCV